MRKLIVLLCFVIGLSGCEDDPTPKPHGYPRIDLPARTYVEFNPACNFSFKKSSVANMVQNKKNPCFYDVDYPNFNAKIHLTYIPIKNDLKQLIDQEYQIKEKHNQFATSVKERLYQSADKTVNALQFHVNGTKAATPMQFFMTDSTNHFFRGVLYFYNTPNNDSLAPVIYYLKEDIDTLIGTFSWK